MKDVDFFGFSLRGFSLRVACLRGFGGGCGFVFGGVNVSEIGVFVFVFDVFCGVEDCGESVVDCVGV